MTWGFQENTKEHQGHQPHDDDEEEEDDNEVEDNNKDNDKNKDDNNYNIRVSRIWDMIETLGFCEDIKGTKGINLLMMRRRRMTMRWRKTTRTMTTTKTTRMIRVSRGLR